MDISIVDRSATSGASALHAASPRAKLAAFALVLAAVVVTREPLVTTALGLTLVGVVLALRLPARPILILAAYPGIFALVFAFAAAPDLWTGFGVVAKAMTAALAAVLLMFTTPYPQVFAPLQRITPSIVGDALLMTYRSFFLLAEKAGHVLTAVRLRSGLTRGHPLAAARAVTRSLGGTLLYSLDLSQRTYDVMRIRGYETRLLVSAPAGRDAPAGAVAVALAALALALALAYRLAPATLAPYSPALALGGCAVLALGMLVRVLAPRRRLS